MNDDDDFEYFEPDMDAYYKMSSEERYARKCLYNLSLKEMEGKITHEQYLKEIDCNFFHPYLSSGEYKELDDLKRKRDADLAVKRRHEEEKRRAREASKKNIKIVLAVIYILFIIIMTIYECSH